METKIRNLITRYIQLKISNFEEYTRLKQEAIDRIQREYIILTGYEIDNNPVVKDKLKNYNKYM